MALQVSGVQVLLPAAVIRPADETFNELGTAFKIDAKIIQYLIRDPKLSTLEEFRYVLKSEAEVDSVIEKVPDLQDRPLMAARVRQAWLGVKDAPFVVLA